MGCRNVSSFILLIMILNSTHLRFKAYGIRAERPRSLAFTKRGTEDMAKVRGQIGSRPPRCERRCSSCERCEAIQVPTNPRKVQAKIHDSSASAILNVDNQVRADDSSNYKPISWKCKCGNSIFNP